MNSYPLWPNEECCANRCYWGRDLKPFAGEISEYFELFPHAEHKDAVEMALGLTPSMAMKIAELLGPEGLFAWPMPGYGRVIFDGDTGYDENFPVTTSVANMISNFYQSDPETGQLCLVEPASPKQKFFKGHVSHVLSQIRNVGMYVVVSDRNVVEPWLHLQSLRYVLRLVKDLRTTQIGFPIDSFYLSLDWYTNLQKLVQDSGHSIRWVEELIKLGIVERDTVGKLDFSRPVRLIISDSINRGYFSSINEETGSKTTWAQRLDYQYNLKS